METALSRDWSSTYSLVSFDCRQVNTVVAFSDKSSLNSQLKDIIMVDSEGDRSPKQRIVLNTQSESGGESPCSPSFLPAVQSETQAQGVSLCSQLRTCPVLNNPVKINTTLARLRG